MSTSNYIERVKRISEQLSYRNQVVNKGTRIQIMKQKVPRLSNNQQCPKSNPNEQLKCISEQTKQA